MAYVLLLCACVRQVRFAEFRVTTATYISSSLRVRLHSHDHRRALRYTGVEENLSLLLLSSQDFC